MKSVRNILVLSFIVVVGGGSALGQEKPALREVDRVRLGAEGLLLDRANPKWRTQYFAEKFDNEKYFEPLRN